MSVAPHPVLELKTNVQWLDEHYINIGSEDMVHASTEGGLYSRRVVRIRK